jgi:hypothetical protein
MNSTPDLTSSPQPELNSNPPPIETSQPPVNQPLSEAPSLPVKHSSSGKIIFIVVLLLVCAGLGFSLFNRKHNNQIGQAPRELLDMNFAPYRPINTPYKAQIPDYQINLNSLNNLSVFKQHEPSDQPTVFSEANLAKLTTVHSFAAR